MSRFFCCRIVAGDIIRLEKVDLKYYQGRPQLNLQVCACACVCACVCVCVQVHVCVHVHARGLVWTCV